MPPRRQKSSSSKVTVPAASDMLAFVFRLHCQTRHPGLGYWARGEHEADHRLRADVLDHIHNEEVSDDDPTGAGDEDQGPRNE
jgi:hypothetical protein